MSGTLSALGTEVLAVACDVSDPNQIENLKNAVMAQALPQYKNAYIRFLELYMPEDTEAIEAAKEGRYNIEDALEIDG